MQLDFKALNELLLADCEALLNDWLPNGRMVGREWTCGDLTGSAGNSLKVNTTTGAWCDFANPSQKGGDLVSLFAAINGIEQVEAYATLSKLASGITIKTTKAHKKPQPQPIGAPDEIPPCVSGEFGKPAKIYTYKSASGGNLFHIARYSLGPDKKSFLPWTWNGKAWMNKHWPSPRPLYNLDLITADREKPILVVEGEKTAEAAKKIYGNKYTVTTWVNGAQGFSTADISPLYNRDLLLWPDMDEPGVQCMESLATALLPQCKSLRIFRPSLPGPDPQPQDLLDGFDLADTLTHPELANKNTLTAWARPRIVTLDKTDQPRPVDAVLLGPEIIEPIEETAPEDIQTATDIIEVTSENESPTSVTLPKGFDYTSIYQGLGILDNKMRIVMSESSVCKVLMAIPELKDRMWFDTFYQKAFIKHSPSKPEIELAGHAMTAILCELQDRYGFKKLNHGVCERAVMHFITNIRPTRSEPSEWLDTLKWDGVPRISEFLQDIFNPIVSESNYYRDISYNIFMALVMRIKRPGCSMPIMPIFFGEQGSGKSLTLKTLAGQAPSGRLWYNDMTDDPSSKDFVGNMFGYWIIELSELTSFRKSEQNTIKSMISRTTDVIRLPYARGPISVPRQSLIFGTTNDSDFLRDPTGARRFFPIQVNGIMTDENHKYVAEAREQLFGEALFKFKNGETLKKPEEKLIKKIREKSEEVDPVYEIIGEYVSTLGPTGPCSKACLTTKDLNDNLKLQIEKGNQMAKRVKNALTKLGFIQYHKKIGTSTMRAWRLDGYTSESEALPE